MFGNLRLKLLAIFFAAALWSVVAYTSNPTTSHGYRLNIDVQGLPTNLVIVGSLPQVPVTVVATADNFRNFDQGGGSRSLHAVGNFSSVKVGPNQVPIRIDSADPAVQVDAPRTIPVTIDELGSANLPVSIERAHALPSGYHEQASATTVTPSSVRVDGPKSLLPNAEAIVVIELDSVTATSSQTPPVVVRDSRTKKQISGMKVTPPQVTVKLVIQADAVTMEKPVGFTLTGQPAAGYRITRVTIEPLAVQATGLQNTLATVNLLFTDPVDVSNQKSDVVKTVAIRPPSGVETNQKTATVHVYISQIPGVSPSPSP